MCDNFILVVSVGAMLPKVNDPILLAEPGSKNSCHLYGRRLHPIRKLYSFFRK